jgi:hypothetical protein
VYYTSIDPQQQQSQEGLCSQQQQREEASFNSISYQLSAATAETQIVSFFDRYNPR